LGVVNPELAGRFNRQRGLWFNALHLGNDDAIEVQGEAMVRGWRAIAEAMEFAGEDEDSFMIGRSTNGRVRLAIGWGKGTAEDNSLVWFTPDEIAECLARPGSIPMVLEAKRKFPGAEIL
jgi:hypothetical protein